MLGFSSDDDFIAIEIDADIKVNAANEEEEFQLKKKSVEYINKQIQFKNGTFNTTRELTEIYFQTIKKVNNRAIGKTAYSVILSPTGIEEYNHA